MCRSVHDEVEINARPNEVYDAYLTSRTHAKITGMPARIRRTVGAAFTAGGDYISGFNLDLVPGRRIVQAWRGSDWPSGAFSLVSLELRSRGKKTRLVFDQRGIPEGVESGVTKEDWAKYYWEPFREYFAPVAAPAHGRA